MTKGELDEARTAMFHADRGFRVAPRLQEGLPQTQGPNSGGHPQARPPLATVSFGGFVVPLALPRSGGLTRRSVPSRRRHLTTRERFVDAQKETYSMSLRGVPPGGRTKQSIQPLDFTRGPGQGCAGWVVTPLFVRLAVTKSIDCGPLTTPPDSATIRSPLPESPRGASAPLQARILLVPGRRAETSPRRVR